MTFCLRFLLLFGTKINNLINLSRCPQSVQMCWGNS